MSIIVEHRPDRLLQNEVAKGCPPELKGAYIGQVTVPTHKTLLEFLEERVVGKEFKDEEELRKILKTWPEFAEEKGLTLNKDWKDLWITSRGTIAAASSPGGDFEVGIIRPKDN